jgi:hypothetical protein
MGGKRLSSVDPLGIGLREEFGLILRNDVGASLAPVGTIFASCLLLLGEEADLTPRSVIERVAARGAGDKRLCRSRIADSL